MDMFLGKVTQQAMNYAIRSGITLTATYAIRSSARLLNSAPKSDARNELYELQQRLQHKIRIVSPAIDMIELIAARGNTSLESAVTLTKELRYEIQALGQRLAAAASASEEYASRGYRRNTVQQAQNETEMQQIVVDIKTLLERIEDAVPLINLAITTSGATLSTQLPQTVSPSRLLQASTFLTAGDTQYSISPDKAVQIGPTFTLTVYMLFAGHNRPQHEEELRDTTWKEVIHKARVKLRRVPLDVVIQTGSGSEALPSIEIASSTADSRPAEDSRIPADARVDEYAYQMMIVEDFDDDRVHDFNDNEAKPGPFDDVKLAGIREMIPIHEISKIFYADTSKVLNIAPESDVHHPVLLLKRDTNAVPPRRMVERDGIMPPDPEDDQEKTEEEQQYVEDDHEDREKDPWRLPASLDPEWIAFEVYTEAESSDDDFSDAEEEISPAKSPNLDTSLSKLSLSPSTSPHPNVDVGRSSQRLKTTQPPPWVNAIKTSLSMLELLLRLTSLQQFQQQSHLSITDELLNFFLEESASTGAGGDEPHRQAVRADARRRVGWDPYDESPLKRRGEEYQYQQQSSYYSSNPGTPRSGPTYIDNNNARNSPKYYDNVTSSPPQPRAPGTQTRSITAMSSDGGYSPSPTTSKNRTDFLRRQQGGTQRGGSGSPLKQENNDDRRRVSDEGIGTSPASVGATE